MALVAIRAVIHIAAYTLMFRICLRLRVAARTRENRVVGRIRVASSANSSGISVVNWKEGVVERRSRPRGCGVAGLAGSWETRRGVIRVGSGLVIGLMARETVGRNRRVVVVHVATGTGHLHVEARQRKGCRAVIELTVCPRDHVMA